MEAKYVNEIAQTIMTQLTTLVPFNVRGSWGIHDFKADVIKDEFEYAALSFLVQGFSFKGRIWISYNEGSDYYDIYGQRQGQKEKQKMLEDICFDQLGEVLDRIIETGNDEGKKFYGLKKEDYIEDAILMKEQVHESPEDTKTSHKEILINKINNIAK